MYNLDDFLKFILLLLFILGIAVTCFADSRPEKPQLPEMPKAPVVNQYAKAFHMVEGVKPYEPISVIETEDIELTVYYRLAYLKHKRYHVTLVYNSVQVLTGNVNEIEPVGVIVDKSIYEEKYRTIIQDEYIRKDIHYDKD